jgi:uncharacterized protein (DUF983 family)
VKGKSKLNSIITCKCPRCRQGNLFVEKNPWVYSTMLTMPDNCPVCNQDFKIEPGFYIGALWTSYPIVVVFGIILFLILNFVFQLTFFPTAFIIAISLIVLQPAIMRWGRAIWIGITVKYDPEFEKHK